MHTPEEQRIINKRTLLSSERTKLKKTIDRWYMVLPFSYILSIALLFFALIPPFAGDTFALFMFFAAVIIIGHVVVRTSRNRIGIIEGEYLVTDEELKEVRLRQNQPTVSKIQHYIDSSNRFTK
jgi:hypothetical protein